MQSTKIGVVILSGGDASRLGLKIPKGCVMLRGLSLFERLIAKCPGPVAVMVSEKNRGAIEQFFQQRQLNVEVFVQKSTPILGGEGESPMGNGDLFRAMQEAQVMMSQVDRIVVCPVDNPLAQPDFQALQGPEELIVLGVEKQEGEQMGTIVARDTLQVVEYLYATEEKGLGYTGIFSASISFFQRAAAWDSLAPVHQVAKTQNGKAVMKQEKFVFDFFPLATSFRVVEVDRKSHFHPIKNQDHLEEAKSIF